MTNKYIVDLSEVQLSDLELVGGKNASLGEMIQNLSKLGVNIPGGFALTVDAYWEFINHNKLDKKIRRLIKKMKKDDLVSLKKTGLEIRQLIRNGKWPRQVKEEIRDSYTLLSQKYGSDITDVAVRSSATAEDLPDASFAGQQETYLNVRGPEQILTSVRNCLLPFSQIEQFHIEMILVSIILMLGFLFAYRKWFVQIWRLQVLHFL